MKEGADGYLRAETFAEHMDPGVTWLEDPAFAVAFARVLEEEIMAENEQTSAQVGSIASRLLAGANPLRRGGEYHSHLLAIVRRRHKPGVTAEMLDVLEDIAALLDPLFADARVVAASALTQRPDNEEETDMAEAAYTKPGAQFPGYINIQRDTKGDFVIIMRGDPDETQTVGVQAQIVVPEFEFYELVIQAQRLRPQEELQTGAEADAQPLTTGEDAGKQIEPVGVEDTADADIVRGGASPGDPLGQRSDDGQGGDRN